MLDGIPSEGHRFDWYGMRVELIDTDGRRVDKVLVTPGQDPSEGADTTPEQSDAA